jgi:hypothetical protein
MKRLGAVALALGAFLAVASPSYAIDVLRKDVTVGSAVERSCAASKLSSGAGYAQQTVTMPVSGALRVSLLAASGDWDVAVFKADKNQVVAGSATSGARELAESYSVAGQKLVVQACRLSGSASSAGISVEATALPTTGIPKTSLVRVSTPNADRKALLEKLGLDVTESAGPGWVDVLANGAADTTKLANNNFAYTTRVPDMTVQARNDRAADRAFAASTAVSEFPSGRTTYRRLFDYQNEMKLLARTNPDLVKPITLNHLTGEGRPVEGIEITTNPGARDGKPVFLQMGVHHAREWPSGEHALEWAYQLISGYRKGDARTRRLVQTTRTIVIPIVNPDGFNASREAGELFMNGGGANTDVDGDGSISDEEFILAGAVHLNEYRRKNCTIPILGGANCNQPDTGLYGPGTDPNRNYGAFWGGPGAETTNVLDQTYAGTAAFSEPESENIRELVAGRQVTTLITNHTFAALVLRPPGLAEQGTTVDEGIYKALGDKMAAQNGYSSQYGYQLYDTTGTTEDWTYNATGGLGFTFELGGPGFHPPYADVIKEWNGTSSIATGGGNREAYYIASENTAAATTHSVISGKAPAGAVLRLTKTFQTPTYSGSTFTDHLDSTMVVPSNGVFDWNTNPSTRPLVAKGSGRAANGTPSAPITFASTKSTTPCANFDTPPPDCYEDHLVKVPSGTGIDNAKATFRVDFLPAADYDMKVFKADAAGNAVGDPLIASGHGATDGELGYEEGSIIDPAGSYVVRVSNYAGVGDWTGKVTFEGPPPATAPQEESYTLFCEQPEGVIRSARQVFVNRGEKRVLDLRNDCKVRR